MSLKYITQTEGLNNPINILKKKKCLNRNKINFDWTQNAGRKNKQSCTLNNFIQQNVITN